MASGETAGAQTDQIDKAGKTDQTDETGIDKTNIDKTDIDKTNIDEANIGKAGIDKTDIDKNNIDKTNIDKTDIDKTNIDKTEKTDESKQSEQEWEDRRRSIPLKVDVEWLDFEHFKNRYTENDGFAIIEVLCGHSQISQEVARESLRRSRGKTDIRQLTPMPKLVVDGNSTWIQRVRIQSPQLIQLLSRLTGQRDRWTTDKPRIFFAPFRTFVHYLPQLKQSLKLLEARWAAASASVPSAAADSEPSPAGQPDKAHAERQPKGDGPERGPGNDGGGDDDDESRPMTPDLAVSGDLIDSSVTMSHVAKFIEFVEKHIEPLWRRAAGTSQRKFRFIDLGMVFQPGELLYVPPPSESLQSLEATTTKRSDSKMYQAALRLYSVAVDGVDDDKPNDTKKVSNRDLHLYAYYMDYDGISYVPVNHHFCISDYEGDRDIAALDVYPFRFVKDADKIKGELREQGEWFRKAVTEKHLLYDGWTLTHGPSGVDPVFEDTLPALEHIEGDVIIDFVEGYKSEPSLVGLGPSSWTKGARRFDDADWPHGDDDMGIMHWKPSDNGPRLEMHAEISEKTQRVEWFGDRYSADQIEKRDTLRAYRDGKLISNLEGDELLLLPRRVIAYTFRERRFVMLDIRSLKSLPVPDNVFDDLKIDPQHGMMVQSLVQSHLEKQAAQKLHPSASLNQDLIRGKGSGLVILLHGVPGVGKTATAEAVAQVNKKPLFAITCGDLGITPREVEDSLKDIFRLAHLWGCILLLDEADIFLSRRELGDLKRNALVSVFLRVLEYYSGILFLTTNRVGNMDEAFKSRIHMSLYYPRLDKQQTLDIFDVNIRKLQAIESEKNKLEAELGPSSGPNNSSPTPRRPIVIDRGSILHFAKWHFDAQQDAPEQRWNGRQIRNAFQVAYSLAQFKMHGSRDLSREDNDDGKLDWRQFDTVATAMNKFEDYLFQTNNGTDSDQARKEHIRLDYYDSRSLRQGPMYDPSEYKRERASLSRRTDHHHSAAPSLNGTPPPRHPRPRPQYQPPPASRGGHPVQGPRPPAQGRPPGQRFLGAPGGGRGGLPANGSNASPVYTDPRSAPRGPPRDVGSNGGGVSYGNSPINNKPLGRGAAPRHDSGYAGSGWSTSTNAAPPTPQTPEPGASQDWDDGGVEAGDVGYDGYGGGEDLGYDPEYDGHGEQPGYDYLGQGKAEGYFDRAVYGGADVYADAGRGSPLRQGHP